MKKEKKPESMSLEELREYRIPKEAVFIYSYYSHQYFCDLEFWGCPRCKAVIEHEGQGYCGACGQRVSWKNFYKNHKA